MKYYRMLNARLNKALPALLIVGAVQVVIGMIVMALSNPGEQFDGEPGKYSMFSSYNGLSAIPLYGATIVAVFGAILLAVVISGNNSFKYHMMCGTKRSTNIVMNMICAVVVAAVSAIALMLSVVLINFLYLATSPHVLVTPVSEILNLGRVWIEFYTVIVFSVALYMVVCCLRRIYDKNKTVVIVTVVVALLLIVITPLGLGRLLPTVIAEFIFTRNGLLTIVGVVGLMASVVYVALELKQEVKR